MRSRVSSFVVRLGAMVALAIAASAVVSPRLRSQLASTGERLGEMAGERLASLQGLVRTGLGGQRSVLEEMSGTTDTATTQWESSMIVTKVAAALAEEPRLRGQTVGVRIIGGILHLEGSVRSEADRELAGEIARRASGARLVANDLRLVSTIS